MSPTLPLPPLRAGVIQLWHSSADEACRSALSEDFDEILSADELQRSQRFRFAVNRQEYLAGRAIVRLVLAGHLGCEPGELVLGAGTRGKPALASPTGERVQFNVSHSAGVVVAAFSLDGELGVDVEDAQRSISPDVIRQAFTSEEIGQWAELPLELRTHAVAARWTLKEAYLKARGDGLHLPLLGFSFVNGENGSPQIRFTPAIDDDPVRWRFYQTRLAPQHVVSLAMHDAQTTVELHDFGRLWKNRVPQDRALDLGGWPSHQPA